jgi:D-alanine-D-alanine ligase
MCDTFIVGREFHVGLINVRGSRNVTEIVELLFTGAPAGFGFKSEATYVRGEAHRVYDISFQRAQLPIKVWNDLARISRRAAKVIRLGGYAKIDLRIDAQGRIFVVEVNANPGLWSRNPLWRRGGFAKNLGRIMAAATSSSLGRSAY